jgi:DNA-binding MarR family transcriptional regulator
VAVVDRLEQMGLLLRQRSNHDRRRYGLCLTGEGQRKVQSLRRQADAAEALASAHLSRDEVGLLLRLLARMAG